MAEEELVLYYNLSVCLSHRRQTDRQKLRHAAHIAGLPSASCMEAAHLPPTDSPSSSLHMCPTHELLHLSDWKQRHALMMMKPEDEEFSVPWGSGGSASRWRRAPAAPPAARTAGWPGSESSCTGTSAPTKLPVRYWLLVGEQAADLNTNHPWWGGERGGGGGWRGEGGGGGVVLSPTVSKEIPARSVRGGGNVTARHARIRSKF